jgi:hypothetical protein
MRERQSVERRTIRVRQGGSAAESAAFTATGLGFLKDHNGLGAISRRRWSGPWASSAPRVPTPPARKVASGGPTVVYSRAKHSYAGHAEQ